MLTIWYTIYFFKENTFIAPEIIKKSSPPHNFSISPEKQKCPNYLICIHKPIFKRENRTSYPQMVATVPWTCTATSSPSSWGPPSGPWGCTVLPFASCTCPT